MTTEQEHLITMLLIKHGGFRELVDTWLYEDDVFSLEELDAVNVWLHDEQIPKPMDLILEDNDGIPFISLEIIVADSEID